MGLDPEGYGNPDFCWLSLYDTLIWSLAGPMALVVAVSMTSQPTEFYAEFYVMPRGDPVLYMLSGEPVPVYFGLQSILLGPIKREEATASVSLISCLFISV